jgi:hypothetical protein
MYDNFENYIKFFEFTTWTDFLYKCILCLYIYLDALAFQCNKLLRLCKKHFILKFIANVKAIINFVYFTVLSKYNIVGKVKCVDKMNFISHA